MERRLYRSQKNRVFLGVCGGLGEYFNLDPVIVRVIAVLLLIPGVFPVIIAYFVLAIIIPLEGSKAVNPGDNIQENISDIKDSATGWGQEIGKAFGNKEVKTDTPSETGNPETPQSHTNTNNGLYILGLILIGLGLIFLVSIAFGWLWRYLWPIFLIVAGLIVILLVLARKK
jgi:phage shock protein C